MLRKVIPINLMKFNVLYNHDKTWHYLIQIIPHNQGKDILGYGGFNVRPNASHPHYRTWHS